MDNKKTKKPPRLGKPGGSSINSKINLNTKNIIKDEIMSSNDKYIKESIDRINKLIQLQNAKYVELIKQQYLADKARNEYLERIKQQTKTTQKRKRSKTKSKSSSKNKKKTDIKFLLN